MLHCALWCRASALKICRGEHGVSPAKKTLDIVAQQVLALDV